MNLDDIEKLGAFYLGQRLNADGAVGAPLLLDERAFTTHAVCIGMTGSGKTGLCTALLEEAAIDGVPCIVVDPKGDLGALALAFPELAPASFLPYLDPIDARRQGKTTDDVAADLAARWEQGLSASLQSKARIQKFKDAAEVRIYTPGSTAGHALSIIGSLRAPSAAVLDDADAFRQRLTATTSGLLSLVGETGPSSMNTGIQSRAHILLAKIFEHAAFAGVDLTIPEIIRQIQAPPFAEVGVLALDGFFPPADRLQLALKFNNLLASPGFQVWLKGDALEIPRLLYSDDGKPRISVLSLGHLQETERSFVITLLLTEVVSWMRQQPGTSSLRCLLFLDEVMGLLPPVANPSTKPLLMTLLKQARAFGVGVVLATQNPVDVDYKALANAGTWLLGRLQTERDRDRVLDGLAGVPGYERAVFEKTLASLPRRAFLVHSVHLPAQSTPIVISSRQTLSYLSGPLSPTQIRALTHKPKEQQQTTATTTTTAPAAVLPSKGKALAPGLTDALFRPALYIDADVRFCDRKAGVDVTERRRVVAPPASPLLPLGAQTTLGPMHGAAKTAGSLPLIVDENKLQAEARARLADEATLKLLRSKTLGVTSSPGEDHPTFLSRMILAGREKLDVERDVVRARYTKKIGAIEARIAKASTERESLAAKASSEKMDAAFSAGSTLLGAIFGRGLFSATNLGKAERAARSTSKARATSSKADKLDAEIAELQIELHGIEESMRVDIASLPDVDVKLEELVLRPAKTDVRVNDAAWIWAPFKDDNTPAW